MHCWCFSSDGWDFQLYPMFSLNFPLIFELISVINIITLLPLFFFNQKDRFAKDISTCENEVGPAVAAEDSASIGSKLSMVKKTEAKHLNSKYIFLAVIFLIISMGVVYLFQLESCPFWLLKKGYYCPTTRMVVTHAHTHMQWLEKHNQCIYVPSLHKIVVLPLVYSTVHLKHSTSMVPMMKYPSAIYRKRLATGGAGRKNFAKSNWVYSFSEAVLYPPHIERNWWSEIIIMIMMFVLNFKLDILLSESVLDPSHIVSELVIGNDSNASVSSLFSCICEAFWLSPYGAHII